MGRSLDFARREPRKPKKGAKKERPQDILPPMPVEVEVIRKGKKAREKEAEEEV